MEVRRLMIFLAISVSSLLIPAISHTDGDHDQCAEKKCSHGGPAIRFPFRLVGKQPEQCGYNSSYDLHCDKESRTILELTSSYIKVAVTNISYPTQRITIESLGGCFAKQLRDLDTFTYPFQYYFPHEKDIYGYLSFFNCSIKRVGESGTYSGLECLTADGYGVYFVFAKQNLRRSPARVMCLSAKENLCPLVESCVKMYDTKFIPPSLVSHGGPAELSWTEPNCGKCGKRGGICGWKNRNATQYGCYGEIRPSHSGILKILSRSGPIIGCFMLVPVIGAMFFLHSRMQQQKENQLKIRKFLDDYAAMKPTRYSYADIKNFTNNFKHKLGEGAYGNVFKGRISNKLCVAVKLLHNSIGNGDDFINEVGTMGTIHHVNVVRLLGFCADGYKRALVFEFLSNGSLDKFIHTAGNEDHQTLDIGRLHNIAIGIARGVEYLHQGCQQRILHFDIKPQNILLDEKYNPKISDFGLAKLCEKGKSAVSMTAARGTMGYIAPEVFSRQFGNVSYKSDLYSFGMLLLEMIGQRKNTDTTVQNMSQVYFPEWLYDRLENGEELRIQIDGEEGEAEITKRLAIVGLWCIQWNPVDRPTIACVLQMLEGNCDNLTIPPNPFTSRTTGEQRREISPALPAISES